MKKELIVIKDSKSWKECNQRIAKFTTEKQAKFGGSVFEHVVKLYLQTEPKYQTKFKQVWLLDEVPFKVKKLLRLPQADEGIDLVVKTNDDEYWSVQAKYRSNIDETLVFAGKGGLSTFQSLSFVTCKNISHGLICATVNKPPVKKHLLKNIGFEVADTWLSLDENNCAGWKRIQAKAKGKKLIVKSATPRPHQRNAIKEAKKHFLTSKNARGKMIMPCGTGKSLTSFWIAHELKAKNIIVAVPSIALIKQTLNTWANESIFNNRKLDWLCVCSDETVENEQDEIVSSTGDLGIKTTTKQKEIEKFFNHKTKNLKVIFTTYQSGIVTAKAARKIKTSFDLGLFDEAHKTVGHKDKQMAHLIFEKNIKIKKRLFMTATERLFKLNSTEYISMDNKDHYGEIFYQLSFKKAIEAKPPIISDYKVITINISEEEIKTLVEKNKFLKLRKKIDNITARELAVGIALKKAIKKFKIKNTLTFHSSIKRANNFSLQQELISNLYPKFGKMDSFHVHGGMNVTQRSLLLKEFGNSSNSIMTNARCLTEGIDLPSIDCVCFTDPKKSKTDIVQASGRALRLSTDKKIGYILIPIIISKNKNKNYKINDESFSDILTIVGALSTQDKRIAEYLKLQTSNQRKFVVSPIKELINIPLLKNVDKTKFAESIKLNIWKKIAHANFRSYEESKIYLKKYNYRQNTFKKSHENGELPLDIPYNPDYSYKNKGWVSWYDFLSNDERDPRNYYDYKKARVVVRKLNFKGQKDFQTYVYKNKISKIPSGPAKYYRNSGWKSWGDFLGTGREKVEFENFDKTMLLAKKLKLKTNKDWLKYYNLGKIPKNFTKQPDSYFKKLGQWKGWPFFLGKKNHYTLKTYDEAKLFLKKLNIKKITDFKSLHRKKKIPDDIPLNPQDKYTNWIGWSDFLSNEIIAPQDVKLQYLSFNKAKKFVYKLGLRSGSEWRNYCKKFKPKIPRAPDKFYKKEWKSWKDWLGPNYNLNWENQSRKRIAFLKKQKKLK